MSDEIKLLLKAIISNQEQARVRQELFETEIIKIFRHVDITEKELDRTIIRVERIEQASH
jgi:hypothetical protein